MKERSGPEQGSRTMFLGQLIFGENKEGRGLPILLLTGLMNCYMTKPSDFG